MGNYTILEMFENPRRGRQARNFTTNVPKILDPKSSPQQIFSEYCRWVPLRARGCSLEKHNSKPLKETNLVAAPGQHDHDFGKRSRGKYLDSKSQEKTPGTYKLLIHKIKNLDLTCPTKLRLHTSAKVPEYFIHCIANLVSREKRPVTKIQTHRRNRDRARFATNKAEYDFHEQ